MIKHSISGQTTISCDPLVLAENIIAGRRITRGDHPEQLLKADLPSLCKGADRIRRALCGDRFEFCTIINARSGRCGEDCRFCAQSCRHHTNAEEYPFLSSGEIAEDALRSEAAGVDRYSIVTAGRGLHGMDFAEAVAVYRRIKRETGLSLCASHGLQTDEEFKQLKAAGVTRYHANIETSARYFPQICTTHTYQNKIDNIQRAHQAGLSICSGGIIGMGETAEDRLDMAISLSELAVDSIPINLFTPIKRNAACRSSSHSRRGCTANCRLFPLHQSDSTNPDGSRTAALFRSWRRAVPFRRKRRNHRRYADYNRNPELQKTARWSHKSATHSETTRKDILLCRQRQSTAFIPWR